MGVVCPTARTRAKISKSLILTLILGLVTLGAFTLAVPARVDAGQAALSWNPSTSTGTIGYKVHFGTSSGQYTQNIDVGNVTNYTLTSLTDGQAYYFAATSYDSSGVQSGYSNEVSKTLSSSGAYTIAATAGSNGTIAALGSTSVTTSASGTTTTVTATVTGGASQSFSITPNTGYRVAGVTVDGASVGAVTSYTFSNVTANHTISATFAANAVNTYAITASAGTGGSITPSGTTTVTSGGSQTYKIAPSSGYYTASVSVDGTVIATNQGSYSYSFNSVSANHTISATFAVARYNLVASAGTGGAISPAGTTVASYGTSATYTITPASGYSIAAVTVDGVSVGKVSSYTFSNVAANHTIAATFSANTVSYALNASAGTGGSISPSGTTTVTSGGSKSFTVAPSAGYYTASVSVDGTVVATNQGFYNYTFSNVAANHTISATFAVATYKLAASAGYNGSISPAGTSTVKHGTSTTYTITPAKGYKIARVTVDGVSVGAVSSYTFSNVSANHTISATFRPKL